MKRAFELLIVMAVSFLAGFALGWWAGWEAQRRVWIEYLERLGAGW